MPEPCVAHLTISIRTAANPRLTLDARMPGVSPADRLRRVTDGAEAAALLGSMNMLWARTAAAAKAQDVETPPSAEPLALDARRPGRPLRPALAAVTARGRGGETPPPAAPLLFSDIERRGALIAFVGRLAAVKVASSHTDF